MVFHLGAGMPHGLEAAGDEVSIAHRGFSGRAIGSDVVNRRLLTLRHNTVNSDGWPLCHEPAPGVYQAQHSGLLDSSKRGGDI